MTDTPAVYGAEPLPPATTEELMEALCAPEMGPRTLRALLRHFGSWSAVRKATAEEFRDLGASAAAHRAIRKGTAAAAAKAEIRKTETAGVTLLKYGDPGFPPALLLHEDLPLLLYTKGGLLEQDALAIAIVGSRRASLYGAMHAERFAFELAQAGFTVVSGLALGIDAAAHRGALKGRGRTLAVLGNGLPAIYPPENEELAGEAGEAGEADRGEEEEAEECRVHRGARGPAAHLRDLAVMRSLVADPDEKEESAGDEAMVQHLQDGAVDSLLVEREDAERDKAHVAHRAVRDELLQVGLHDRHDRTVDDGDHREHDDKRREVLRRLREERDREADEAVAAQLQQNARQDHRAGSGCLYVRVGEPRVEREHRHLDRKGECERGEGECLQRWIDDRPAQSKEIERAIP